MTFLSFLKVGIKTLCVLIVLEIIVIIERGRGGGGGGWGGWGVGGGVAVIILSCVLTRALIKLFAGCPSRQRQTEDRLRRGNSGGKQGERGSWR